MTFSVGLQASCQSACTACPSITRALPGAARLGLRESHRAVLIPLHRQLSLNSKCTLTSAGCRVFRRGSQPTLYDLQRRAFISMQGLSKFRVSPSCAARLWLQESQKAALPVSREDTIPLQTRTLSASRVGCCCKRHSATLRQQNSLH